MRAALGLVMFAIAAPAQAQDREIVVTGEGMPAPEGDRAYAVATIDAKRLAESDRLEDALRDVAGIAQFRRSDSRSAHPTSQGITLRGLGGNASSRALLLLDGVPQADPFGGWVAFPAYQLDRLGGVRVTRGGGSGYAGPGALAGTIELTSAGPDALPPLGLAAAFGSRDSIDANAVASARLGRGFAVLAGQYARGDGFVPIVAGSRGPVDRPAPYEQASASARAVIDLGGATEIQANLLGFTDSRDRGVDFTGVRSEGADASLRLVGRGRWEWSALAYLQNRAFASSFASVTDARDAAAPVLDQRVPSTGIGARIELQPPLGAGVTVRVGGDARRVSGRTQERYLFAGGAPTRGRVAGGESATLGAFADASVHAYMWTFSIGGRVDRWSIAEGSLIERDLATGAAITDRRFADRSGWEASGRAGVAFEWSRALTLRLAPIAGGGCRRSTNSIAPSASAPTRPPPMPRWRPSACRDRNSASTIPPAPTFG